MDNITAEELARHILALGHSVTIINDSIASENTDEQTVDDVRRNYQHIEIMLAKDFIANSEEDLSAFQAAAAAGKDFVEANE